MRNISIHSQLQLLLNSRRLGVPEGNLVILSRVALSEKVFKLLNLQWIAYSFFNFSFILWGVRFPLMLKILAITPACGDSNVVLHVLAWFKDSPHAEQPLMSL